jgi:lipoteichoic acid synthase
MIKELTLKLKTPKIILNDNTKPGVIFPVTVFLLLNALKITLFNYFIIPTQNVETFTYKLVVTILFTVIIYSIIFKIKTFIPFILIYVAQTLYIVANISYYMYYHNYVHILQWITLFNEAFIAAGHSSAPVDFKLLISFIDLPFFAYIIFNYLKVFKLNSIFRFQKIFVSSISLIIIICILSVNHAQGVSLTRYTSEGYKGESKIVENYGTLVNNMVSLYLSSGEEKLISRLKYGNDQANTIVKTDKPNFVIIQVESLDAGVINQKYKDQYIAPFLHLLSTQNIYYPYLMSYHMGGGTSDTEFSIINSVEPLRDYPAIKIEKYDYQNSFIKKLSQAGYNTSAYHGNVGEFYDRNTAFPKMGFNNFFDIAKMKMENHGWGAPDNDVFKFTTNYLKSATRPFLSYNITMTSHGPFENAKNYYSNKLYDDIQDELVKNYYNSMSYTDQSINNFVTQIRADFKNTYIFIWGDHTPGITSNIFKQASFISENKYFEFVPLIIITPDNKVYKENKEVESFLDISPTILKAAGIKFDIKSNGENLIDLNEGSDIPFNGDNYNREDLFKKISNADK